MVEKVKTNVVRCSLPGTRVSNVMKVAKNGRVKARYEAVLWVSNNNVRRSTNVEFQNKIFRVVDMVKVKIGDVKVIEKLPSYKGARRSLAGC